jgi:hypothetical protein
LGFTKLDSKLSQISFLTKYQLTFYKVTKSQTVHKLESHFSSRHNVRSAVAPSRSAAGAALAARAIRTSETGGRASWQRYYGHGLISPFNGSGFINHGPRSAPFNRLKKDDEVHLLIRLSVPPGSSCPASRTAAAASICLFVSPSAKSGI